MHEQVHGSMCEKNSTTADPDKGKGRCSNSFFCSSSYIDWCILPGIMTIQLGADLQYLIDGGSGRMLEEAAQYTNRRGYVCVSTAIPQTVQLRRTAPKTRLKLHAWGALNPTQHLILRKAESSLQRTIPWPINVEF